jgi:serine protease
MPSLPTLQVFIKRVLLISCLLVLGILTACDLGPSFLGPSFLNVRPANVLTPEQPAGELTLQNPTKSTVAWSVVTEQDPSNPVPGDWFTLARSQGELSGGSASIVTLRLNSGLPAGLYTATLSVRYQDKEQRLVVMGQIPGTATGAAQLSGSISTDNALIPIDEFLDVASPAVLAAEQQPSGYVPGQILVKYKEADSATIDQLSSQQLEQRQALLQSLQAEYGLRVLEAALPGQADLLETTQDVETVAERLNRDPRVEYATPNYFLQALELPNDPDVTRQWALAVAGVPVAWQVEQGNSNRVTVAVLDTGFDLGHEDLTGRFLPGYDFCSRIKVTDEVQNGMTRKVRSCEGVDDNPSFSETGNIHGTHVAGLLGALGNNARGVTGVAYGNNIKLLPIKIFDDTGDVATIDSFSKGIRWAVGAKINNVPVNPNPARIINLSLGGAFQDSQGNVNTAALRAMQDAVDAAHNAGALLVAATGNSNSNFVLTPAAANHVLGVGSVDANLQRSNFSNFSGLKLLGPGGVDLMAPGNSLLSTTPGNTYNSLIGTSMSTPIVSGIAALLLSREPDLSPQDLETRLLAATYFDKSYMSESRYGQGILRADLLFGLPGPQGSVAVALGNAGSSALTTTTLDVYGATSTFRLSNLSEGNYRLVALSNGEGGQLLSTNTLSLQTAETKTLDIVLK